MEVQLGPERKRRKRSVKPPVQKPSAKPSSSSSSSTSATPATTITTMHTNKNKKQKLPLSGLIIAVSTLSESSSSDNPDNYNGLVALCKEAGAETTGQVHKKVKCVVATQSAVDGKTQRVRKAWKRGAPVVSPEWLRESIKQQKAIPFDGYVFERPEEKPSSKESAMKTSSHTASVKDTIDADCSEEGWSEKVDLGCCCVCHENGSEDCPWCVDCSVNRAKATAET